jgi:hypothetical protein
MCIYLSAGNGIFQMRPLLFCQLFSTVKNISSMLFFIRGMIPFLGLQRAESIPQLFLIFALFLFLALAPPLLAIGL